MDMDSRWWQHVSSRKGYVLLPTPYSDRRLDIKSTKPIHFYIALRFTYTHLVAPKSLNRLHFRLIRCQTLLKDWLSSPFSLQETPYGVPYRSTRV